jgi:hypothetical protein
MSEEDRYYIVLALAIGLPSLFRKNYLSTDRNKTRKAVLISGIYFIAAGLILKYYLVSAIAAVFSCYFVYKMYRK